MIGTGNPGRMNPENDLGEQLEIMGIEARIMPTQEATKEYNTLQSQCKNVAGCFYLIC
ncbi:MAG: hypothetical protein JW829_19270 [Pirellulales bacterium]|nr:hypothetical protein [Pirellulales bacterium]